MSVFAKLRSRARPDLRQWWSQRPRREQLLLAVGAVAAVVLIGDSLVIQPLEKKIRQAKAQHSSLEARWQQGARQGQVQRAEEAQLKEQEAQLRARVQAAQARVGALDARLQDTAQLPQLLRAITATLGATRLLELQVADDTGATPVAAQSAQASTAPPRRLYRLPMTLKVSGSWSELNQLMTQIERHAEGLQWTQISLDSSSWPAIELTLKAHVLSLHPRWGATT